MGQRPAGCERQRSRRWEPQPGQCHRRWRRGQARLSRVTYTAMSIGFCQSDAIAVFFCFSVASLPSQALRASSPRGGASGVSVRFRLNEQSLIYHKQECPATEASSSLTRNSVPKLLPSVAGHSFLRYIELSAVSSELTGLPMAPPLGELSRRRRD